MSRKFSATIMGAAAGMFFTGGLFGGIIGGMIGNMFDSNSDVTQKRRTTGRTGPAGYAGGQVEGDPRVREFVFVTTFVSLLTSVAKADNEIHASEVEAINQLFQKNFHYTGHDAKVVDNLIRQAAKTKLDVPGLCAEIKNVLSYPEQLMILRMLYVVAFSDKVFKDAERDRINQIADFLRISKTDHDHVRREFNIKDTSNAYVLLDIESSATDKEVKSAYREMVRKYHPDKVAHLGKEFTDMSKAKFVKIQNAYDQICKERNL